MSLFVGIISGVVRVMSLSKAIVVGLLVWVLLTAAKRAVSSLTITLSGAPVAKKETSPLLNTETKQEETNTTTNKETNNKDHLRGT
jgi:hypothetical protein